ncbi:hypothetical protein D3C87_1620000 [compost metagenome]
MKQANPFPAVPPKAKQTDPFAKEKRAGRKSIAQSGDFEAMIEIVMCYASERKRMADIGALDETTAANDIARATKLLDKVLTSFDKEHKELLGKLTK